MRIRWTAAAADDLEHIRNYLREHRPDFADPTVRELYEATLSLKTSPRRGRPGRETGTRELVVQRLPYIVAYRIRHETIEILHIFHASQSRS